MISPASWENIYLHIWFLLSTVAFEEMASLILDGFIRLSDTLVKMRSSIQILPTINEVNSTACFTIFQMEINGTLFPDAPARDLLRDGILERLRLPPLVKPVWVCECLSYDKQLKHPILVDTEDVAHVCGHL